MNNIKFRVWYKKQEQMEDWEHCLKHFGFGMFNSGDVIFMQYTSLIDIDGMEIYEGDIVKVFNTITGSVAPPKRITWNSETARFNGLSLGTSRVMKVVGNIYENPELVSPTQNDGEAK